MLSFILGCIIIAVIVTIGLFFLRLIFAVFILVLGMIVSIIAAAIDKVMGK